MRYISLLLVALLIACSLKVGEERLVGRDGERALREGAAAPLYVGVSLPQQTEAEALESAMQDARRQIVESLGIEVCIQTLESGVDTVRNGIVHHVLNSETTANFYARNILQVAADKRYVEKWEKLTQDGLQRYYKAWVGVSFSEDEFRALWRETIRKFSMKFQMMEPLSKWSHPAPASISDLFILYQSVLMIKQEFLSQYWMIHLPEYQQFEKEKGKLENVMRNLIPRIRIDFIKQEGTLSGFLEYDISFEDEPIPGMPVRVFSENFKLDRVLFTDSEGKLTVPYAFEDNRDAEMQLVAGCTDGQSDVVQFLPAVRTRFPSPLNHRNITILIDIQTQPDNTWFQTEMEKLLTGEGYRIVYHQDSTGVSYRLQGEFRAAVSAASPTRFSGTLLRDRP